MDAKRALKIIKCGELLALLLCLVFVFSACISPAAPNVGAGDDKEEITEMYISVNGNKLEVALENNRAANALTELLKQGDIVYTAHGNNFEIYGDIGQSLPTDNKQITSQAGDVLLWAGSNICIFFGNNSYSYTRIGKINGYSASELRALLGADDGDVQVTISLK